MSYPEIPQAFWDGTCFDAYRWMGAHPARGLAGEEGWQFVFWAPGAREVRLAAGGQEIPMDRAETGFWSVFVPGLTQGDCYQYRVTGADGTVQLHADPYGFASQLRPGGPKAGTCP